MLKEPLEVRVALIALAFVVGGFLVGVVIGRVLLARLDRLACRVDWEWCHVLVRSLRGMPALWATLIGIYAAAVTLPLEDSVYNGVERVVVVLAILSVTWALARLTAGLVNAYTMRAGLVPATSIFTNLAAALVFVLGLLIALQYLGIAITPVLTALGVGGLAVALALQDTLSNLFAGFHLIASGQVNPGNYVKLESGEEGYVVDITWRNTTIRELANNMIVVPNSRLASVNFTNFDRPEKATSLLVPLGVGYGSDLDRVEEVTLEVARELLGEVEGGEPSFEPLIRFHTFGDSSIDFNVVLRVREFVDGYFVKHEFVKRVKRRYDMEGIEIPFPIRTVDMRRADLSVRVDGNGGEDSGAQSLGDAQSASGLPQPPS